MEAGRVGEGDGLDGGAGALGDGVESTDFLELVAEEIEAVGFVGGDGINVDDATAHGVVAGGFADGLAVIVEGLEVGEQGLERVGFTAAEDELAAGKVFEGGHVLEDGGGGGADDERGLGGGGGEGAAHAEAREHGVAIGGGGEGLAYVAAIGQSLGEQADLGREFLASEGEVEREVFDELFGVTQFGGDDEPHGGGGAAQGFREHGPAGRGADAGEFGATRGRGGRHERGGGGGLRYAAEKVDRAKRRTQARAGGTATLGSNLRGRAFVFWVVHGHSQ